VEREENNTEKIWCKHMAKLNYLNPKLFLISWEDMYSIENSFILM
jgi:hypothetical protein